MRDTHNIVKEDARTTRAELRSLMENGQMMMEDAWMTIEAEFTVPVYNRKTRNKLKTNA